MGWMDQKVVVVTGAAGAIGRATIEVLKREGAVTIGVDIREPAETAAHEFMLCDLRDEAAVETLYAGVAERHGRVDSLFNNAGSALDGDGSVLDVSMDLFSSTIENNVNSVILCCKYGIPHLIAGGGGTVLNTSSLVASMGSATSQISYAASKGAVNAISRELAIEFATRGVRVNTLSPGPVDSPMLRQVWDSDEAVQRRMVHVPTGRLATEQDLAEAALFLLSPQSSYVVGHNLLVDGGISQAFVTAQP